MLKWIRVVLIIVLLLPLAIPAFLICLLRPFHPNLVYLVSRPFTWMVPLLGVKVELRGLEHLQGDAPRVIVANHQNSLDLFICPLAVVERTVSIGKKSLKWIPIFGQIYWISGNILIDRKRGHKAAQSMSYAKNMMMARKLKVWVFAEGTRSYGRGLLPLKTGAFRLAADAQVPIVTVCVSDTNKTVDMNRWNNGKVIIEVQPPYQIAKDSSPRAEADSLHTRMKAKIDQLTEETMQTVE